jgi:hypothetical protein
MRSSLILKTLGGIAVAVAAIRAAHSATQVHVSLAGRDDSIPKLGRPGISVRVDAPLPNVGPALTGELTRELAEQVHTRPLSQDDAGDYRLDVTVSAPREMGGGKTVPFEAVLRSAEGRRLWRIEGRAEIAGAPVDASVFSAIGRNVISALIHDGWVQPRYDPDNPPPPPPVVHSETP